MSTNKTILIALATVVMFAAGVVTGGLLVHKTSQSRLPLPAPAPGPGPGAGGPGGGGGGVPFLGRVEAINRAANQLDLSTEQRDRVTEIIRNGREQIADYFVILEPDIQQVFRDMRQKIQAELTPAQRTEFEDIFRKRLQRQNDRRPLENPRRPGPGQGPPQE